MRYDQVCGLRPEIHCYPDGTFQGLKRSAYAITPWATVYCIVGHRFLHSRTSRVSWEANSGLALVFRYLCAHRLCCISLAMGLPGCYIHGFYLPCSPSTEMPWGIPHSRTITTVLSIHASLRHSLAQQLRGGAYFLASTPQEAGHKVLQFTMVV